MIRASEDEVACMKKKEGTNDAGTLSRFAKFVHKAAANSLFQLQCQVGKQGS